MQENKLLMVSVGLTGTIDTWNSFEGRGGGGAKRYFIPHIIHDYHLNETNQGFH